MEKTKMKQNERYEIRRYKMKWNEVNMKTDDVKKHYTKIGEKPRLKKYTKIYIMKYGKN